MKVAIVGGKLQGTELVYLAKEAGYETILVDWNPQAPASGFCDRFLCEDVTHPSETLLAALREADFIMPANENDAVLDALQKISAQENLPLAFDPAAYAISSSKQASDALFLEHGLPAPQHYPAGEAPYIMKPSRASGSQGVTLLRTKEDVASALEQMDHPEDWIIEEYISGPSYSIEVIGDGTNYQTYSITKIHMDEVYDCCRVTAPCPELPEDQQKAFAEIGRKLGEILRLKGIMDVEVIYDGRLKVLEIDARFPSQTPIAIYHESHINLFAELAHTLLCQKEPKHPRAKNYSVYEHYRLAEGKILCQGEHMMEAARPLTVEQGLFGADAVISDFTPGCWEFRGIFISAAATEEGLSEKRATIVKNLEQYATKGTNEEC